MVHIFRLLRVVSLLTTVVLLVGGFVVAADQIDHHAMFRSLPPVPSSTNYTVMYLEAPLFKVKLGDVMQEFDMFHAGLGFQSVTDPTEQYQCAFVAAVSVLDGLIPSGYAQNSSGGPPSLVWDNAGITQCQASLVPDYWTQGVNVSVGTINGDLLNRFFQYATDYNTTHPYYMAQGATHDYTTNANKTYFNSMNCFDFAINGLRELYVNGADLSPISDGQVTLQRDYVYLYADDVTQIDYFDPTYTTDIITYYNMTMAISVATASFSDMIESLLKFNGNSFFYDGYNYYKQEPAIPVLWIQYDVVDTALIFGATTAATQATTKAATQATAKAATQATAKTMTQATAKTATQTTATTTATQSVAKGVAKIALESDGRVNVPVV